MHTATLVITNLGNSVPEYIRPPSIAVRNFKSFLILFLLNVLTALSSGEIILTNPSSQRGGRREGGEGGEGQQQANLNLSLAWTTIDKSVLIIQSSDRTQYSALVKPPELSNQYKYDQSYKYSQVPGLHT